jgi:hypothetical protein
MTHPGLADAPIYLDCNATTPVDPAALQAALAVRGAALAAPANRRHVITLHPAVLQACRSLQGEGFTVTHLPVDGSGRVNPANLADAITAETALVLVASGNSETGTLQPISELATIARARGAVFHTDAAQAVTKVDVIAVVSRATPASACRSLRLSAADRRLSATRTPATSGGAVTAPRPRRRDRSSPTSDAASEPQCSDRGEHGGAHRLRPGVGGGTGSPTRSRCPHRAGPLLAAGSGSADACRAPRRCRRRRSGGGHLLAVGDFTRSRKPTIQAARGAPRPHLPNHRRQRPPQPSTRRTRGESLDLIQAGR